MMRNGERKAIEAVRVWVDAGRPSGLYLSPDAWTVRHHASTTLAAVIESTKDGKFWRGTNRRAEYNDIENGATLHSTNHADGSREAGLSVSPTPATIAAEGYCYAYQVTGTVVGTGSDGEPVLVDIKIASPLFSGSEAIAQDRSRLVILRKIMDRIADETGVDSDVLFWLAYQ